MGFGSAGTVKPFLTVRNVVSINWKELGEGVCEASGKGFGVWEEITEALEDTLYYVSRFGIDFDFWAEYCIFHESE